MSGKLKLFNLTVQYTVMFSQISEAAAEWDSSLDRTASLACLCISQERTFRKPRPHTFFCTPSLSVKMQWDEQVDGWQSS